MPQRVLVIGDIHGGLLALEQLLERVGPKDSDRLIFVGDYVDGWSQSAEVISFLIELEQNHECIFLRGNHDIWCAEWLRNHAMPPVWLINGGATTVESYIAVAEDVRIKHLEFFGRLKSFFIDEANRLFVHAGYTSNSGPAKERNEATCSWDRTLWEQAMSTDDRASDDDEQMPTRFQLFAEIFIGHTPTIIWNADRPMHRCNVWNVDTGSAFSGKLTALDVDTKEFWQSDIVQDLYPGERGRN